MPHPDPYRSDHADGPALSPGLTRGDVLRSLLWIVVVVSAVANMVASFGGAETWVHLVCGAVTVLGGGALVVRGLRSRP